MTEPTILLLLHSQSPQADAWRPDRHKNDDDVCTFLTAGLSLAQRGLNSTLHRVSNLMEMTAMQSDAAEQPTSDTQAVANSEISQRKRVSERPSPDVISDEVLRHRIRELITEKTRQGKIRRAINHSLFALLVQFCLTTLAGTVIVYYFNSQQQSAAARRSFVDEMNKMRVQRIGEVWEHLDVNEFLIDKILANNSRQGSNTDKDVDEIHRLIDDDLAIISKNRFWLGDDTYSRIRTYLDLNIQYALNQLMVTTPGIDLTDLLAKREKAKQDILRIRNIFLEGKE